MLRASLIILIVLISAAAAMAQEAASPAPVTESMIENAFLAKDDGQGRPGDAAVSFGTADIPIYCIVELREPKVLKVSMVFVAVDVAGVRKGQKVVSAAYVTKANETEVHFTGRPQGKWTAGKYRVDISLDGKPERSLDLTVADPLAAKR